MSWKKGPLPKDTYGWGGVVPTWHKGTGFYFADFCGDSVKAFGAHRPEPGAEVIAEVEGGHTVLKPEEVAMFNNSLELPPKE